MRGRGRGKAGQLGMICTDVSDSKGTRRSQAEKFCGVLRQCRRLFQPVCALMAHGCMHTLV